MLQVILFEIIWIAWVVGERLVMVITCRSRDLTSWMLLEMMEIISGGVLVSGNIRVVDQLASGAGMCPNNYNFR